MADAYIVDVDVERIRALRSREHHRPLTEAEIRQLLVENGFYPRTDGLYIAEQPVLQRLDPSEIIAARPVAS